MSSKDLYELLNVPSDADVATIQKAFRELSLRLHPDKANASSIPPGGAETETERKARERRNHERFVKIVEARDILTDPEEREEYDRKREKKHSTNQSSRPSRSSETSKPERKNPPPSTPHQETRTDFKRVKSSMIRRLERLALDLDNMLSLFTALRPRSRSSAFSEYIEILRSFDRVMEMNRKAREHVRNQDTTSAAAFEAAMEKTNTHIVDERVLVSELESILDRNDSSLPPDFLYHSLRATFARFFGS